MFSGAVQFRYTPDERVVWKVYAQYDRTDFSTYEGDNRRLFGLGEDNIYVNATFRGILPESGVGLQGRPILTITGDRRSSCFG